MRITKLNMLTLISLTLFTSALVFAQRGQGRGDGMGRGQGQRPEMPVMTALDADKDQTISADEIANASTALKTLDTDSDGKLISDELMPKRPERPEGDESEGQQKRERPEGRQGGMGNMLFKMPILAALDTDQNQEISADEISNAATALETLDKNADGQLTQDELRPQRQEGQGRGQRPER